jgi:hypothetical protein
MLGRLLIALLGVFLMMPNNSRAESIIMPVLLHCTAETGLLIEESQTQYGEIPFFQGRGAIQGINGSWSQTYVVSTVNPETSTYTIIIIDPISGAECFLMVGAGFSPAGTIETNQSE